MAERAPAGVRVVNPAASLAFYRDIIGFHLLDVPMEGLALVDTGRGAFALIGPAIADPAPYMTEGFHIFKPGDTVRIHRDDLDERHRVLSARGLHGLQISEMPWGDRVLRVPDPDGHVLSFIEDARLSPEQQLTLYASGAEVLQAALDSVQEADLDLSRGEGQWSIRQIVHHIADGELLWSPCIKAALAEPGAPYVFNLNAEIDNDQRAIALAYTSRAVEPSVAIVCALRAHLVQLVQTLPEAWERQVLFLRTRDAEGRTLTVGELISLMATHLLEHVEEIKETCQA